MRKNSTFTFILAVLFGLAVLAGLTWANYRFARQNPGGNDFLSHWVGTRALLYEGKSPYSDEILKRTNELALGRELTPEEYVLPFPYPLYATLFFAPFAMIGDFVLARAVWMTAFEILILVMAVMALNIVEWRPGFLGLIFYLLFSFLWYHAVRTVINGNGVMLVAFFFTLCIWALKHENDELAGLALAFSSIKPNLAILVIALLVGWAIINRRNKLVVWCLGSIVVLTFVAMIFIPDWIQQNFFMVLKYPSLTVPGTPGAILAQVLPGVGRQIGWGLTVLMISMIAMEWWAVRRTTQFTWILWTFSLTLTAAQWIGIQTDPGNFIVLFLPFIFVVVSLEKRLGRKPAAITYSLLLLFLVGLWALFLATVQFGDQPQQSPIMLIPLPLFLLIGLYWIRWWATRPQRSYPDLLRRL